MDDPRDWAALLLENQQLRAEIEGLKEQQPRLISGLTHDLSNLLMAIVTNAGAGLDKRVSEADRLQILTSILAAAEQATKLLREQSVRARSARAAKAPVAEERESPPAKAGPIGPTRSIGESLCVLVVDDEDIIRLLATHTLSKRGHEVLFAADGDEAHRLYLENETRLGLVVLDLSMPGMGGDELARLIRERAPHLPLLLTSGLDEAEVMGPMIEGEDIGYLQKPFRGHDLVVAVDALLTAHRARSGA